MPRIDPLQLLKCLSVLLSPEGGILSRNEVPRLVSLMTKFSKKLVSKCVYVLILKNTETSLVDMFMAENGWTLVQSWLQDAVPTGNWVLVKEILELLLVTPVDVDRLKLNHLPKLIKSLTRKEGHPEVARLSDRIVQNWLMIVKGSASSIAAPGPALIPIVNVEDPEVKKNEMDLESVEAIKEETEDLVDGNIGPIKTDSFYKITVKDGKQVIRKLSAEKDNEKDEIDKKNDKEKSSKSSSSSKPSSSSTKSSSSSSKSSSSSSSRDKERNKSSSRSGSSSSKSGSSSRDKSRDKDRDRKDKDRKSSSSKSSARSSHSSSSSKSRDKKDSRDKSKDPKETQSEKDKDALDKLLNPKPFKSARIPKLSSNDKPKENKPNDKPKENKSEAEVKKPSYSILNRKSSGEERGKTVKVFNSKMRSTGLEEIAKPPPKRSSKKPTPSIQLPTIPSKRPSPPRDSTMVSPEKKIKIDKVDKADRPGAIKLIAPKPKPILLQESDMFSDALTAAAPKKDAKKRKRRLSSSKEATGSPSSSGGEPLTPTSPTTSSSTTLKNIAPINFYQDTLSEQSEKNEMEKEDDADADEDNNDEKIPKSPNKDDDDDETPIDSPTADIKIQIDNENMPPPAKQMKLDGELKGILVHEKKQSTKRSIQWKPEKDLVQTRYFELDETERINVTKTFTDMAKMDIDGEREAMINSRISSEDKMAPAIQWYAPFLCEELKTLIVPGTKSLEKDIQFAREKAVPAAEYFNKRMIPDNPKEPEFEVHQKIDPFSIPLEDPEGHVIDLANKPWPEAKGFDPKMEIQQQQMPPMFPNNLPFNSNFNNMPPAGVQFVGVPQRFPGPPGPHGPMMGPANFNAPHMMHNNMIVPPMNQPDMMNGGPMNPGMFASGPDGFMGVPNEQPYPMPQFNGGPQGPMYVPNNFRGGNNGGRGNGFRRGGGGGGGGGGWVQVNGPRPWKRGSGGPHRGSNRPCKNIQNHGYCRNLDTCPFRH